MTQLGAAGLALIKEFEGCVLHAYHDTAGVLTIGYGHTGRDVHPGLVIDEPRADALLQIDLAQAELAVNRLVTAAMTQGQFDALVSFAFNLGWGTLAGSKLLRYLNQGDAELAGEQFQRWIRAGGKIDDGLVRRRAAELKLFQS